MEAFHIVVTITVGIGATFLVDLWNVFLKRAFSIRSLNYCLLDRLLRQMPEGTFRHASITDAPQKPFECAVGWMTHILLVSCLRLFSSPFAPADWPAQPTLLPALFYGIGTLIFPFFILQPSFGPGIASSMTPNPTQARLKRLMPHTVFGGGLWVHVLGGSYALRGLA